MATRSKDLIKKTKRILPASHEFRDCLPCIQNTWMWEPKHPVCKHLKGGVKCHGDRVPSTPIAVVGQLR